MTDQPDDRPARQQLQERLQQLCPKGWTWVTDERDRDDDERTRIALSQQTISPGKFGSTAAHRIGFTFTVTVPQSDVVKAEEQLDDDILSFLVALTNAHIQWTECKKAFYGSRLGYRGELEIGTRDRSKPNG